MNYLRRQEIQRLLAAARSFRDLVLFRILLATGIRTREASTLNVEDVDHERQQLRVLDSKKHVRDTVPIDRETLEVIRFYVGSRTSGPLFLSQKGGTRLSGQGIYLAVRRAAIRAGINIGRHVTPRTCRHTFADEWDDRHGPIRGLQRILRHKHLSSTAHYLDSDGRMATRTYRRLFDVQQVPRAKPTPRRPLIPYVS